MIFNDRTDTLKLLATRRSGKARDMVDPGPSDAQLQQMLEIAARIPDHGKLSPWRFTLVPKSARNRLHAVLETAYLETKPDAGRTELEAIRDFAHAAPTLIVVTSSPVATSHIPLWEQQLSSGAATMNLMLAAHAMGFVANWLTGWATYSATVRDALASTGEQIVGFIFIGSAGRELSERPRPDLESIVRVWAD